MATITLQERTDLLKMVSGLFNAAPGKAYLEQFSQAFVDLGRDFTALGNSLAQSSEFQNLYPNFLTADEFATKFLTTLNLQDNAAARASVVAQVEAGSSHGATAVNSLLALAWSTEEEFKDARDQLNNKAAVAEYYSVTLGVSSNDFATLQGVVNQVTADPASVEAAKAAADGATGKAFTLTTGIDNLTGTAGDDTFIGDNSNAAALTVGAGDQIDGGAGTDTFNYYGAAAAVVMPQMKNVEVLNLYGTTVTTLNTATVAGLEQVNLVNVAAGGADIGGGTGATDLTLGAGQALGLNNVTQTGVTFVTADFGATATAATLNVSNGSSVQTVELNGAAITTLNVNSSGSKANTIAALTSTGTENTVKVSGDQKVTITAALAATVKTIDASAMTAGGVVVTAGNADISFTGGAGNDRVDFAASNFNSKDVVDGGAGRDTVVINDTAVTGDVLKAVNALKNVEVLGFGTTAASLDVSTVTSVAEFLVAAGAASTTSFTNASATDKFFVDNTAGATTVNVGNKVGELSTTVTLDNQAATGQTLGTLKVDGATTVNLASTGKAANTITTLTVGDNSSIVVTGDKDLTITNGIAATTTGHKIDASGFGGKLGVIGSGEDDIIIGSAQADTIGSSAGKDTITLGGGNDTFEVLNLTDSGVTVATADTITDWGLGADKIDLSALLAGSFTYEAQSAVQGAVNLASPTDFAAALTAAATVVGVDEVGAFQYDGNTYVFANTNTAAIAAVDDVVIQLQGLQTLTVDDFVL